MNGNKHGMSSASENINYMGLLCINSS